MSGKSKAEEDKLAEALGFADDKAFTDELVAMIKKAIDDPVVGMTKLLDQRQVSGALTPKVVAEAKEHLSSTVVCVLTDIVATTAHDTGSSINQFVGLASSCWLGRHHATCLSPRVLVVSPEALQRAKDHVDGHTPNKKPEQSN